MKRGREEEEEREGGECPPYGYRVLEAYCPPTLYPVTMVLAMIEKSVEQHLVRRVKALGGLCWKWVSPSQIGVPDRVVVLPGGRVVFVELKRPGGKLSAIQVKVLDRLREVGAEVQVLSSKEEVDELFVVSGG